MANARVLSDAFEMTPMPPAHEDCEHPLEVDATATNILSASVEFAPVPQYASATGALLLNVVPVAIWLIVAVGPGVESVTTDSVPCT
jgi:hypothetical protein